MNEATKDPAAARHSSETAEHYTPAAIIEAARETLGGAIDLDPASCEFANRLVKADRYHDATVNGYRCPWFGRVFLNPPGGQSDNQERVVKPRCRDTGSCGLPPGHTHEGVEASAKKWWFKLAREYAERRVRDAVFVGFSVEILQSTQNTARGAYHGLPIPLDFALCFPAKRIDYDRDRGGERKPGGAPPHASVVVYLPPLPGPGLERGYAFARFVKAFAPIGAVLMGRHA